MTNMFVFYFVFLVQLAISAGQSDIPQYAGGDQWQLNENPQYDIDEESSLLEDNMLPENSSMAVLPTIEDQNLQTTPESYLLLGQGSDEVHDSKVWKIVLITAVLLVSLVGSLGAAYYLCVWRGGRIHYQPQRTYA